MHYFKDYKAKMRENTEIIKLLQVVEEKNTHFCGDDFKLSLIFEYSPMSIES
jgi:hypothetical protein